MRKQEGLLKGKYINAIQHTLKSMPKDELDAIINDCKNNLSQKALVYVTLDTFVASCFIIDKQKNYNNNKDIKCLLDSYNEEEKKLLESFKKGKRKIGKTQNA